MAPRTRGSMKNPAPNTPHQANQKVNILIGSLTVGSAIIMEGKRGNLCRKLHGHVVIGPPGEDLVIVKK